MVAHRVYLLGVVGSVTLQLLEEPEHQGQEQSSAGPDPPQAASVL